MTCLFALGVFVLITPLHASAAQPDPRWFNTMVAHWTDYGDPDYLQFL
ncbi:MAG: hypothetical protein HY300_13000, partial [Verrucomicrobia bacterium]|nr:hypothetical protein [Verrucomicrobiota bacterium]